MANETYDPEAKNRNTAGGGSGGVKPGSSNSSTSPTPSSYSQDDALNPVRQAEKGGGFYNPAGDKTGNTDSGGLTDKVGDNPDAGGSTSSTGGVNQGLKNREETGSNVGNSSDTAHRVGSGYNPKADASFSKGLRAGLRKNRRKLLLGGGVTGALVGVGLLLLTFSGILQLDTLLNNLDVKTFSRFNASVSGRSDTWLKSYIKVRMMERQGSVDPINGNLYFRTHTVDTNNPFSDWYRTMRTSSFENDLFKQQGITFTSMVGPDGRFRAARITFNRDPANPAIFDPTKITDSSGKPLFTEAEINKLLTNGDPTLLNKLGPDLDKYVQVDIFNSDKEARKALRETVTNDTRFLTVIRRRQVRKDIANMTGIRSWTFFEKTRTKVRDQKVAIQQKIIQKVFSSDTNTQNFIRCLFGAGPCSTISDPNDPINHVASLPTGSCTPPTPSCIDQSASNTYNNGTDPNNGNKPITSTVDSAAASDTVSTSVKDAAGAGGVDSPTKAFIAKLTAKFIGDTASPSPSKIWPILKKLASVDNLLWPSSGGNSKLVTLVKNARTAQAVGLYATYAIARDQLHTGDNISGDQVGAMMSTMYNFNDSEGWQAVTGNISTNKVSAAAINNPDKATYCSPKHKKLFTEFAWFCPDEKPNAGGNATAISNDYANTVGIFIHPIAQAVNAVKNSILGWIGDLVNGVVGFVLTPIVNAVLSVTGLGSTVSNAVSAGMQQLLAFVGVGPAFDGSQPGAANYLLAGSAATAEASTRDSGGIKSTPASLKYSDSIAANYQKQTTAQESLYTRYASLSNSSSLLSTGLYNLSTMSWSKLGTTLASLPSSLVHNLATIFSGPVFAASTPNSAAYAQFAGVDTYDIPQECQNLDPLDPNYLTKATNAWQLGIPASYDTLNNPDQFWNAVYGKLSGTDEQKQAAAETIYNCGTLDQRVRGGLGGLYGYTNDGGYN